MVALTGPGITSPACPLNIAAWSVSNLPSPSELWNIHHTSNFNSSVWSVIVILRKVLPDKIVLRVAGCDDISQSPCIVPIQWVVHMLPVLTRDLWQPLDVKSHSPVILPTCLSHLSLLHSALVWQTFKIIRIKLVGFKIWDVWIKLIQS